MTSIKSFLRKAHISHRFVEVLQNRAKNEQCSVNRACQQCNVTSSCGGYPVDAQLGMILPWFLLEKLWIVVC